MKTCFKSILFIGLLLIGPSALLAEDINISAEVDKNTCSLNEQIQLNVTVQGNVSNIPSPQIPPLNEFDVYSAGRSQNISIVNGQIASAISFTYILSPKTQGNHTLPPISLSYKGKTYSTQPILIKVTEPHQQNQNKIPSQKNTGQKQEKTDGLFITNTVNKKTCYVNEQITMSFRFYNRMRLTANPNYGPPSTTGFWKEDLPPQRNYTDQVNGIPYSVNELKTALFPTSSGRYTIGAATLQVQVDDFVDMDPFANDFFRSFFSGGRTRTIQTDPIDIEVLPLPSGAPADFGGAVGRFKLITSLDSQTVSAGEPITFTIKISGEGNIRSVPEIKLPSVEGFRVFNTVTSLNTSKINYVVEGSKEFKTVLIPQSSGNYTLPSINFSFFDPKASQYKTIQSPPLKLTVTASKNPTGAPVGMPTQGESNAPQIQRINQNIRFIQQKPLKSSFPSHLFSNPLFLLVNGLFTFLFLTLMTGHLIREKIKQDPLLFRYRNAKKLAKNDLAKVHSCLKAEKTEQAIDELSKTLKNYCSHKLKTPATLTLKEILPLLSEKAIPETIQNNLQTLWEEIDLMRFALAQVTKNDIDKVIRRASDLMTEMEHYFK